MHILLQNLISVTIFSYNNHKIKAILQRQRLKLTKAEIVFYISCIFYHTKSMKNFKLIYKENNLNIKYNSYIKNILLCSKFLPYLFEDFNKSLNIKASELLNVVDSSLITTKKEEFINSNDFKNNKVTIRNKNSKKQYICGYKGFVFLNRKKQIFKAFLKNINFHDQNLLKDSSLYCLGFKGILLTDRGFNCKLSRERVKSTTNNKCKLIAPKSKTSKCNNEEFYMFDSIAEQKIYRFRWKIEVCFKNLKDPYQEHKLNLSSVRSYNLIKAKYFTSIINYNLSTI